MAIYRDDICSHKDLFEIKKYYAHPALEIVPFITMAAGDRLISITPFICIQRYSEAYIYSSGNDNCSVLTYA